MSTDLAEILRLRPLDEYHEDLGDVLWWIVPITEAPYCGKPSDCGHTVEIHTSSQHLPEDGAARDVTRIFVGGWPGYHTHWSPLPSVVEPSTSSIDCPDCEGDGIGGGHEPELCGEGEDRPCERCGGSGRIAQP